MKNYFNLIVLFGAICLQLSCTEKKVRIMSDFDHGSIGVLEEVSPGYLKGNTKHWKKRDGIGDQYYWFYFRTENVKDRNIVFELSNLEGIYRGNPHLIYSTYTQPVFSYDQKNWLRIQEVSYDSASRSITFSQNFSAEPVWIAYAHPYPHEKLLALISAIEDHPFVIVENLATTQENRDVQLVSITDPEIPTLEKKSIFLMSMQHSGEDAGAYFMEGIIRYLLSDDENAKNIREHFIYHLIPMMNPDGVFNGTSRYNMAMEDLNNIWFDETKMQPEVSGVQQWLDGWYAKGNKIDMFWDVHNHSQFYRYNVLLTKDNSLDNLHKVMTGFWPMRIWTSEPVGSSHAYFLSKGITAASLELTQSFAEEGAYLTIDDYHGFGKATVLGFREYFNDRK